MGCRRKVMMNNPIPNPDLVGDLFWGIFKPQ